MSVDKYPSIFSRQMEAIVYVECSGCWSSTKWLGFSVFLTFSKNVSKMQLNWMTKRRTLMVS